MVSFWFISRLKNLLSEGDCVIGGETVEKDKFISPTVLTGIKPSDPIMESEVLIRNCSFRKCQNLNTEGY